MFRTPFYCFGVPQDAPTLTLISGSSTNPPRFLLNGDLAEADTVREQHSQDATFVTGVSETTNTIDAAEDAANQLDFVTGALSSGTWYFRMRTERPPRGVTAWSNTETITFSGEGGPIALFGRWFGGFGMVPPPADGGWISLFGRWFGGFGSAAVTPPASAPTGNMSGGYHKDSPAFPEQRKKKKEPELVAEQLVPTPIKLPAPKKAEDDLEGIVQMLIFLDEEGLLD